MEEKNFSFRRGWDRIPQGKVREVRTKLMTALGITTRVGFLDRLNGKVEPRVTEHAIIEQIFCEYGINDIWGAV